MRTIVGKNASSSWQWLRKSKWRIIAVLICVGYVLGSQPRQAAALVRKYQGTLWNKNTAGKLFNYFAAGTGMRAVQDGTNKSLVPKNKVIPPRPNIPGTTTGGGDTAATATPICSLPYMDSGTTVGATDNYDLPADTTNPTMTGSCATIFTGAGPAGSLPHGAVYTGTGTAPDVVYKLEFPVANPDTLTITMDPTGSQDLSLVVYCNTVSSNPADAIVIDDTGVGGDAESVTIGNIAAGTTLYIVVDGYSAGATPPGPSGTYTLSVTSSGTNQPNCAPVCAPITCPTNITTNTTPGACTAVVNYTAPTGANCTITCSPPPGSTFNKGTTTVTCSNTGGSPSCSFLVFVSDNQNPTITCPSPQTATSPDGNPVNVSYPPPTATDNCPGVTSSCTPPSGSPFPVGTTTVTCTAMDATERSATCNFTVTVAQCAAIVCPANITRSNDPNQCGAVVTYPPPTGAGCGTITCTPPSGSFFPKGTTTVTCTSSVGNRTCSFTVTVNDTQPPAITCPANIFLGTTGTSAVASFTTTASDNCPGVTIACVPPSGSSFNVGVTTVTCTATDASSNTATCSFQVTVNRVAASISDPLACTGPGNELTVTLNITNNGNVNQTVADTTTFTNFVGIPGSCTTNVGGTCTVTTTGVSFTGTVAPGQTAVITYRGQVSDVTLPSTQACTSNSVTFNGGPAVVVSACATVTCPPVGPGGILPATSEAADQKAGSVLVYNDYTSAATSANTQNTRINNTNTHLTLSSYVH